MRPWLVLKHIGIDFTETLLPWAPEGREARIAAHSASGKVPILKTDDGVTIWDSLAICEYLADRFPEKALWPAEPTARALARSAAAEMHSGFQSLRGECPMDIGTTTAAMISPATGADVRRLVALWSDLLARSGGPFLLGDWSIADAFYTPVASRFRSYSIHLSDYGDTGGAGAYAERLLETPEFLAWASGVAPA